MRAFNFIVLSAMFLILCASWVRAYYQLPELKDLIDRSDVICIGTVDTKVELHNKGGFIVVKSWVIPEKILKGTLPTNPIEVISGEYSIEECLRREDPPPPFPSKGQRVLLFLEKKDDRLFPVSQLSGVYKIMKRDMLLPVPLFSLAEVEKSLGANLQK